MSEIKIEVRETKEFPSEYDGFQQGRKPWLTRFQNLTVRLYEKKPTSAEIQADRKTVEGWQKEKKEWLKKALEEDEKKLKKFYEDEARRRSPDGRIGLGDEV